MFREKVNKESKKSININTYKMEIKKITKTKI